MYNRFEDPQHKKWAKAVKEKDNFTCQICNKQGVYLNSHHIYSWDKYVDLRFIVNNGITLCQYHHDMFHKIYGEGKNTRSQYDEYARILDIIKNITLNNGEDIL